ncbi:chloride channel protein [Undibacterium sp.]|uniref:chloride channel protein n=1 Tax=Undibacterium sp. TaxID=1914977 RepID=UPI002D7FA1C6|nr:chloride channel protein [Undibacterium sp.]
MVGLAAVGLAMGSEYANKLNRLVIGVAPWSPLLFMPAGFALLAYCCDRFFPGSQGSGIPQTIAAMDVPGDKKQSKLLSARIAIGKIVSTLGGLCIGASIGREGPTVQIGASIMHMFCGRGPFQTAATRRILILAGGAAGIAAAFNTPLAGIMFAIEELSKKHVFNANSSTLVTVIVSGLISLSLLGNYTYFGSSGAFLDWHTGLTAILLCGVVGGSAGGVFSRLLIASSFHLPPRVAALTKDRRVLYAALCGLAVAALGVCTNGLIFGTGYEPTRLTLENSGVLPWYFGLAKLLATLATSMSGIVGGIFAPSLAVGAGLGDNLADLFPMLATHSALVLLVMASYLSGVTRAPVTSFIIMMEMTDSHQMLLPLMAASVIASGASKLICPTALYHALSKKFIPLPERFHAAEKPVQAEPSDDYAGASTDKGSEHFEDKK